MPCHGYAKAYRSTEVNIGWYPHRALRPTVIMSKPGGKGVVQRVVKAGDGIAVQSVRNPSCKPDPQRRPAVDGWVWCHARNGAKTGWIERAALGPEDRAWVGPIKGPAGLDFEVGRTLPTPQKKPSACGKKSLQKAIRTVKAETVYLRYSPRGTAVHYLHCGDRVRVLLVDASGYHWVEVVSAAADSGARKGVTGWMTASALA